MGVARRGRFTCRECGGLLPTSKSRACVRTYSNFSSSARAGKTGPSSTGRHGHGHGHRSASFLNVVSERTREAASPRDPHAWLAVQKEERVAWKGGEGAQGCTGGRQ